MGSGILPRRTLWRRFLPGISDSHTTPPSGQYPARRGTTNPDWPISSWAASNVWMSPRAAGLARRTGLFRWCVAVRPCSPDGSALTGLAPSLPGPPGTCLLSSSRADSGWDTPAQSRQSGVLWEPEHLRLSVPLDHCRELLRGQVLVRVPLHLVADYRAPAEAVTELANADAVGTRQMLCRTGETRHRPNRGRIAWLARECPGHPGMQPADTAIQRQVKRSSRSAARVALVTVVRARWVARRGGRRIDAIRVSPVIVSRCWRVYAVRVQCHRCR